MNGQNKKAVPGVTFLRRYGTTFTLYPTTTADSGKLPFQMITVYWILD